MLIFYSKPEIVNPLHSSLVPHSEYNVANTATTECKGLNMSLSFVKNFVDQKFHIENFNGTSLVINHNYLRFGKVI